MTHGTAIYSSLSGYRMTTTRPLSAFLGKFGASTDVLVLIAAFLVAGLPYAASSVLMYPDEPQYLDAGVFMCQTNDWLMPACPNDANPEDLKPIFSYWIVALSYKLFGASLAAARIPSLLAGVAIILLTYRLALLLSSSASAPGGSRTVANLACALLLCNLLFWLSATRSLPDIWLCLFVLISAHGFLGLLTLETPTAKHALLAYVGVGLAFLAKGVPALMFLGYAAFFFAAASYWRPGMWRRLIHVPSMAVGGLVAISWFVIVLFTHGPESLRFLWADQVATRAQRNPAIIAFRLPIAFTAFLFAFAPLYWPIWKMGKRWTSALPAPGKERLAFAFIGGWVGVNLLAMCCATDWYLRYLLPVFPLVAVAFAIALAKVDLEILTYCFRRLLTATVGVLTLAVLGLIVLSVQLDLTSLEIVASVVLVLGLAAAASIGLRGSWIRTAQAIPVSLMLLLVLTFFSARNIARPDIEDQIGTRVNGVPALAGHDVAGFVGPKGPATRLRLALAPRVRLWQWENLPIEKLDARLLDEKLPPLLIVPEELAARLPADRFAIYTASSVYGSVDGDKLMRAIWAGRLKDCLLEQRRGYRIAVRIDGAVQTAALTRGSSTPSAASE